jgi:hypothetical protein
MIPELLLGVLAALTGAIEWLIPDVAVDQYMDELSDLADLIAQGLGAVNGVLPVSEMLTFLRWVVLNWYPAYFAYVLGFWLWSKIPILN